MNGHAHSRYIFAFVGFQLLIISTCISSVSFGQQGTVNPLLEGASTPADPLPLEEPAVIFPNPTCQAGVNQFDTGIGQLGVIGDLQSIRSAFQKALTNNDLQLVQYLQDRLTELVGTDQNVALSVVNGAESAQGDELILYLKALQGAATALAPEVVERLLTMAERHGDPQHRIKAALALGTQSSLTTAQLDRLAVLGKDQSAGDVAAAATGAIGLVMRQDPRRVEEYVGRLLDIAHSQTDERVIHVALELCDRPGVTFGESSFQKLADLLLHHPSTQIRIKTAMVIAAARDSGAALNVYRQAFQENSDLCVRWAIMKFALRAAGAKALPLLEEFAALESRLQQEYVGFKNLYDAGMVDFDHIWLARISKGFHPYDLSPLD